MIAYLQADMPEQGREPIMMQRSLELDRLEYDANCPFCSKPLTVYDTTSADRRRAGLIYLRMKCVDCVAIVEAVGVGTREAIKDMDARIAERIGTHKSKWQIKPLPDRRRKRK